MRRDTKKKREVVKGGEWKIFEKVMTLFQNHFDYCQSCYQKI